MSVTNTIAKMLKIPTAAEAREALDAAKKRLEHAEERYAETGDRAAFMKARDELEDVEVRARVAAKQEADAKARTEAERRAALAAKLAPLEEGTTRAAVLEAASPVFDRLFAARDEIVRCADALDALATAKRTAYIEARKIRAQLGEDVPPWPMDPRAMHLDVRTLLFLLQDRALAKLGLPGNARAVADVLIAPSIPPGAVAIG